MESSPPLRRSKSLKRLLSSKARRDSVMEQEEPLPPVRSGKPTLREYVGTDDIGLRPRTATLPLHPSFRVPSARNTWPQGLRESKPGTYAFDQVPTLIRTPWEQNRALRSTPRTSGSTTRSSISSHTFARLPREILHCVLDHLWGEHLDGPYLDVPSYRSDLRKLCITNKQWHRVAREHLYGDLWIPWNPTISASWEYLASARVRSKSSLTLLLRTLEDAPGLARLVKRIRVPSALNYQFVYCGDYINGSLVRDLTPVSILSPLCELIYKCPNLCAFSGFFAVTRDSRADLMDALASRSKLKEHVWTLPTHSSDGDQFARPEAFVQFHLQWNQLQTLVLRTEQMFPKRLGPGTISAILQRLPLLRHLSLSHLSADSFHNGSLLMLPSLKSLRLEDVAGINDQGLQQMVHSRLAMSLESFSLIDLCLTSLRTVQTMLDNLPRLKRLRFSQIEAPELQEGFTFAGTSFSLSSNTLEYLYWNTRLPGSATAILANAIAGHKLPKLRTVKIPSDDDGAVQKLCRPIWQRPLTASELSEHVKKLNDDEVGYRSTTQFMELAAQLRAKRARKDSVFSVTVEDEEGVEEVWAGSYLGSITSKIEYSLRPDIEASYCSYARAEDLAKFGNCNTRDGYEQAAGLNVLF